ncbi:glutathione S-transferase Mu 1-like [Crotalus adamanteus]|uniref:Glutathione S-transferase n=1 Tax=Crotalus adamanteus TaxID=8729 RepID=A0AAW1BQ04_CROAD
MRFGGGFPISILHVLALATSFLIVTFLRLKYKSSSRPPPIAEREWFLLATSDSTKHVWSRPARKMEVTLGYWNIRGLAHCIKLLLEYTKTPYNEKHYAAAEVENSEKKSENTSERVGKLGIAINLDLTEWTSVKEKLGLDFPNLPYLIDGDRKISQSNAILRYIARKHKMCGETEEEMIRVDMLENHLMDFRMNLGRLCYDPDFEKLKPEYLELLPGKLKLFSQFLGDMKWFAGKTLTYVDFIVYDVLDVHQMLEPKCLDQFPNLKEFFHRVEALETIADYLKSSRCIRTPIFLSCASLAEAPEEEGRGDSDVYWGTLMHGLQLPALFYSAIQRAARLGISGSPAATEEAICPGRPSVQVGQEPLKVGSYSREC